MPSVENMQTNDLDDETDEWFRRVLQTIETLDVEAYLAYMSDDVELVMDGGRNRVRGKAAVAAALTEQWSQLESLVHDEVNIYGTARKLAHETVTHVVTRDGAELLTPTCVWIDRDESGLISSARIY